MCIRDRVNICRNYGDVETWDISLREVCCVQWLQWLPSHIIWRHLKCAQISRKSEPNLTQNARTRNRTMRYRGICIHFAAKPHHACVLAKRLRHPRFFETWASPQKFITTQAVSQMDTHLSLKSIILGYFSINRFLYQNFSVSFKTIRCI